MEALFGEALTLWGGDRSRIEIITKCGIASKAPARPEHRVGHRDTSASHIRASVDRSLAHFGRDYLDLLLIHRPDPFMDADETARGLEDVVKAGKVRAIGISNHEPSQVALLQSRLSIPLVTNQVQASVLHLDPFFDGTFDQSQQLRARPMIWSPLGGGAIFSGTDEKALRVRAALARIGARMAATDVGQTALAWLMAHPVGAVPVVGTGDIRRLRAAVEACDLSFERQDWFEVLEAARGAPLP
jgi:predicted oxidoreductase